ncbi:polyprenol monophosphomannose synthase [Roseimaritima ulvae]|uniref:Undecaprenyl-phosphate mannosyltransferase n=1 Tax=Roseimaritima ulvae TaxID=980254 RepID=A0A5B9QRN3_9BACT|nr:polyprenol monophosphomannose synthase [Roseimaritima ulvae]QEG40612.1 Undecaprenyl-phosphate mannosyltransferase [Roseimaritima ulvae]
MPAVTESAPSESALPSPRVLVVVCTYNERENLPTLLPQILAALPTADVLVVDDDSPDGTGSWAEQTAEVNPRVAVIVRKDERGLGGALKAGIRYADEQGYDFLLNLDGDQSHRPADLPRLLALATAETDAPDIVVGSRYVADGKIEGWPLHRRMMSRMVNGFATKILRLPVKDCSGAFRCYRMASLRRIPLESIRSDGYAMLEELLLALHRDGAKFAEIPITFNDRQVGESKLTTRETIRSVRSLLRMIIR